MKYIFIVLFAAIIGIAPAFAHEGNNTIKLTVLNHTPIEVGKPVTVELRLTTIKGKKPVAIDQLKEVHTKHFHALIIDPTLVDYHHEHPVENKPGEYSFTFTPNKPGNYRIWADITPLSTGKQEYAIADLKAETARSGVIDKTTSDHVTVDGITFDLSFDAPLKTGQATMGKVIVTKDGKTFNQLEPVMGAYAHIVGFNEDWEKVIHIHPMGEEPTQADQRGGPELQFHIEPAKSGFVKLFVQTRINGKDVFAPFGVRVE